MPDETKDTVTPEPTEEVKETAPAATEAEDDDATGDDE